MYKYFEVLGQIDGMDEVLFGSYDKEECKSEIYHEKDYWKADGYKKIRVTSRMVEDEASTEVYDLLTIDELYEKESEFNEGLDKHELLEQYLEEGLVRKLGENKFLIVEK